MQFKSLKYKVVLNAILALFFHTMAYAETDTSFDLKASYDNVNFTLVDVPACSDEAKYIPALPKNPKADFYYRVARKILGQRDIEHYDAMYVLGKRAADMGHWQAKLLMAELYLQNSDSHYSEYKPKQARIYLEELMSKSVPAAFYVVGQNILSGYEEFSKMPSPASVYLFHATKLGNPKALLDMYDIFKANYRTDKEATTFLDCAIKQKEGKALAYYKLASILENKAQTEQDWVLVFSSLYSAVKEGSFDAISALSIENNIYKSQFGKSYLSKQFLDRVEVIGQAMNPLYTHSDPNRKEQGKPDKVKGNIYLTFPHLERILPLPPSSLPEWNRDITKAMGERDIEIYRKDFNYGKLIEEVKKSVVEDEKKS